jgi:hypothetical protein
MDKDTEFLLHWTTKDSLSKDCALVKISLYKQFLLHYL